jgi:uncharacterized protein
MTAQRRNAAIDALRGVAVLGTFASNIWIFTTRHNLAAAAAEREGAHGQAGLAPTHFEPLSHWKTLDGAIALIFECLSNGKFLALLSILFGVGMCAQFESAQRHGYRWPWRYYWRTTLLFIDGLLHHLFVVEFDILMGYALAAFVAAPLLLLRGAWRWVAVALAASTHLALEARRAVEAMRTLGQSLGRSDETLELVSATSLTYGAQVSARWEHFWAYRQEAFVLTPPLSITLFLLGAQLWRGGWFDDTDRARAQRKRLATVTLCVGAPLTVLPTLELLPIGANFALYSLQRYTVAPIVGLGYLCVGLTLLERRRDGATFARLSELGRSSLSVYVLQNILCSALFYRWGLALAPLSSLQTALAWAALSATLALCAWWWSRGQRQGPFERLWRWLSDAPFARRSVQDQRDPQRDERGLGDDRDERRLR